MAVCHQMTEPGGLTLLSIVIIVLEAAGMAYERALEDMSGMGR